MLEIIVGNTAEAFASLLDRLGTEANRVMHEFDLAGRALLWGGPEKIVATFGPIDLVLVESTAKPLNCHRLEV